MESAITLQDAANIATYVAPGYFAIRVYAAIFAKQARDFWHLFVESVVASFPIVAFTNWIWELLTHRLPTATSARYALVLLAVAVVSGLAFAQLRVRWPVSQLADWLGLAGPDEDFMRAQFARLSQTSWVTLTLKNGEIVSGKPRRGSLYVKDAPREYYFTDIAWYDKTKGAWDKRSGGLIINLDQVEYIETP